MVLFKNQVDSSRSFHSYPEAQLNNLMSGTLNNKQGHNIVQLVSSGNRKFIHKSLLRNVRPFLADIISSLPNCDDCVIILPSSPPDTLGNLVTLLYTGQVSGLSKGKARHVLYLAKLLDLDISREEGDGDIEESDEEEIDTVIDIDDFNKDELKVKTKMINKTGSLTLSFPESRSNKIGCLKVKENLDGFDGRVQQEYNSHPVGKYMGPYDQNKEIPLKVQLPGSDLDFRRYTEFYHDGKECFDLRLAGYKSFDDLAKIDAYQIIAKRTEQEASESESDDEEPKDDKKMYSCQYGKCRIPCPCPQCHLNANQCPDHKIKHPALFDNVQHSISIRSSEEYCINKQFFKKSYITKFSGIPLDCQKCQQDLLYHHSYHLEYHDNCRFCKQSWHKHKARTTKEFHDRVKDEVDYFRRVCPFCNKQFILPYHAKRHIENEHKKAAFKCSYCEKVFQSKQAKSYHETVRHVASNSNTSLHQCQLCKKMFSSEINLKSHTKYAHSDKRQESCPHCDTKFKEKKNLRAHLANIHGINQMREKYCEDEDQTVFKCKDCDLSFNYKKSLAIHRKAKHEEKTLYECDICHSKFTYKHNMVKHVKLRHKT